MRPGRQVRRAGTRPSYARRTAPQRRQPGWSFPVIQVAWVRLAAIGAGVLLLLVVIANLTSVKRVRIEGNAALSTEQLTKLSNEGLGKQWFGRNLILVNTMALESYLEEAEPAVRTAEVRRDYAHTVVVKVVERQPTLSWRTGGATYLLDADATVIGPTPPAYAKLPTVIDTTGLPVKEGDRVAPTAFVQFCSEIAKQLPGTGFQIKEMSVPTTTSEVYVRTDKNLVLKFDTTRPAGEEIADLKAVQAELTRAKKHPVEYIDLRIPNKAYYK